MTGHPTRSRPSPAAVTRTVAVATLVAALVGCAGPSGTPDLRIGVARASVPVAGASQLVLDITNAGDGEDRLVGAETTSALAIELHLTEIDERGRAVMRLLAAVVLPAGETVRFRPGGLHLMLVVPDDEVVLGGTLEVTLRFERSGDVTLPVTVVPTAELLEDGPGAAPGAAPGP